MGKIWFARPHVLFIDIDGVLTKSVKNNNTRVPKVDPRAINRLKELVAQKFEIALITSRSAGEVERSGFLNKLEKAGIFDSITIYPAQGLESVSTGHTFHVDKKGKPIMKNGEIQTTIGQQTRFAAPNDLMSWIVRSSEIERSIRLQLQRTHKIKLKAKRYGTNEDGRVFFEPKKLNDLQKMNTALEQIVKKMSEPSQKEKMIPIDMKIEFTGDGFSLAPKVLGKHFGSFRALIKMGYSNTPIQGRVYGDDREIDRNMKIRRDMKFVEVDGVEQFLEETRDLKREFQSRDWRAWTYPIRKKTSRIRNALRRHFH